MTEAQPLPPISPLPPRPDLVLRVAFAGTRALPTNPPRARASLEFVYGALANALLAVVGRSRTTVARFYSPAPPLVRLISGLAEGADDLAAQVMSDVAAANPAVRWELAGVLAFRREDYRASREAAYRPRFDELCDRCAYVIEVDGIFDEHEPSRRHRAYRAQSAVLLRQADILIAIPDSSSEGRAGGTHEAVRAALALGLPVVLIDPSIGSPRLIDPGDDVDDVMSRGLAEPTRDELRQDLESFVSTLAADQDRDVSPTAARLLEEFFDDGQTPCLAGGMRRETFRERLWQQFELRFSSGPPAVKDVPLAAYQAFRARASSLNRHYTGLYRGAFLSSFGLAVFAVGLAALTLVVLAGGLNLVGAGHEPARTYVLIGLGVVKLLIIILIVVNTGQSNRNHWNDRAVDYRYLAERLRSLYYLPGAGSVAPQRDRGGYTSRRVRQSAADWLFDAIVRHVSSRDIGHVPPEGTGPAVLRLSPIEALASLRERWLEGQKGYHANNELKMRAMLRGLERRSRQLGIAVIAVVCVDLAILAGHVFHVVPPALHGLTLWLIFAAAVLPAGIAAANGVRVQSECERLAERSHAMGEILDKRIQEADDLRRQVERAVSSGANPGAWTPAVLRLAEDVATDMLNEAAEWSVLYAKVIPDQ